MIDILYSKARVIGNKDIWTEEVIYIGPRGFSCMNCDQPMGALICNSPQCECSDYEARFCCGKYTMGSLKNTEKQPSEFSIRR